MTEKERERKDARKKLVTKIIVFIALAAFLLSGMASLFSTMNAPAENLAPEPTYFYPEIGPNELGEALPENSKEAP